MLRILFNHWLTLLFTEFVSVATRTLIGVRREALVLALSVLWWRVDVLRMLEPSVAMFWSVTGETELLSDPNFGFLLGDGELWWWAFDRVRLAIQFLAFLSTGTSSSLLISIGSDWLFDLNDLWRFNLFADAVLTRDKISVDGSLNSSGRRLTLRFELLLSVFSNASVAVFFLLRRFDCVDSKLSANIYHD